ncbi:MAG: amino acid racemase [Alphaproteobacteria bacterium]|nr:MAG: amino acid racemase [Alphaproteobacteria bacterium]
MTAPRRIGILGGMGPEATVLLMQRLIEAVPARDDSDHIPLYVDMNPQVPSRIARLIEGRGPDPGPVLVRMAQGLERMGAKALAMPCNTAHHYAPQIAAAVTIPFIDMIALAADAARDAAGHGAQVGMLASPAVKLTGVFEPALAARGLTPLWPDDTDQAAILDAIRAIKRHGLSAEESATVARAARALADRGARVVMVACTELSLASSAIGGSVPVVDTLDALVEGIVTFALDDADAAGEVRATG